MWLPRMLVVITKLSGQHLGKATKYLKVVLFALNNLFSSNPNIFSLRQFCTLSGSTWLHYNTILPTKSMIPLRWRRQSGSHMYALRTYFLSRDGTINRTVYLFPGLMPRGRHIGTARSDWYKNAMMLSLFLVRLESIL